MAKKGAITIPTWNIYVLFIVMIGVVAWFAIPGAKEWMMGVGLAAAVTVKGWALTINESPIWQGYWYIFVGIGAFLVFQFGRWTYKKQDNLLHYMAIKARLRAAEVDDGMGMYGGQDGGPSGPGGGLTPEQRAALKKQQEALP